MSKKYPALLLILGLSYSNAGQLLAGFSGSQSCANCHAEHHRAWQGSHHDLAMQHVNAQSVLGDFSDSAFTHNGITSRFYRQDGKYYVHTDGSDGSMQEFEIGYTFGVDPLQQYLVEFPDGRLQALSIAWDSRSQSAGGQRWFHLYPDETFAPGDRLHWTGSQQNWNYMCADCHSTNLSKAYSPASNTFKTTWSEINVACEACHGPGEDHIQWAAATPTTTAQDTNKGLAFLLNERKDVTWPIDPETGSAIRSTANNIRREIEVCASCHSRRGTIRAGAENDASFMDHHMPAMLTQGLYHADGQILDEVYVWGSFQQSKMYAKGVTCSDCHNPHSLKLRAEGPGVCAQCHQSEKFASTEHHKHRQDSAGANCLDCHMLQTTYMQVDPRRDHSIRVPRPEHSIKFGTPNACTQCHRGQSDQWAAKQFAEWYPQIGGSFQNWTNALHKARQADPTAEIRLLKVISDTQAPDIARASALQELQNYLSPLSGPVAQQALSDENPLLRLAALRALQHVPVQNLYPMTSQLLQDPVLAVRSEAARMLAAMPIQQLSPDQKRLLDQAVEEYIATQELHADRVESQMNLGNLNMSRGNTSEADRRFRKALELDPGFIPVYINLSDLYRAQGLDERAIKVLRNALVQTFAGRGAASCTGIGPGSPGQ